MVSVSKADADKRIKQMQDDLADREKKVSSREDSAEEKERELNDWEADLDGVVQERLMKISGKKLNELESEYKKKNKHLQKKYDDMTTSYQAKVALGIYYDIVVTVLYAIFTPAFRNDFIGFFKWFFDTASESTEGAVGAALALGVALIFSIIPAVYTYNNYRDGKTVAYLLTSLAVVVFGSKVLTLQPIPLVPLYIIGLNAYVLVRKFIEWDDKASKKEMVQYSLLMVVCLVISIWALQSCARDLSQTLHH